MKTQRLFYHLARARADNGTREMLPGAGGDRSIKPIDPAFAREAHNYNIGSSYVQLPHYIISPCAQAGRKRLTLRLTCIKMEFWRARRQELND